MSYHLACSKKQDTINKLNHTVARVLWQPIKCVLCDMCTEEEEIVEHFKMDVASYQA